MTGGGVMDRRLWTISAVVILGAVMSILDTTIVNVAIATLARDFNAPLSTIQWVATGYLLALATVIPLTGWAAERFGTKRLFLTSVFLFVFGSLLCGLAWSADSLIAFRVVQGLGGGMLMPAGMTILTQAAGPQRVGRVMSVIGVPMLLAPVFGPILGGWLVQDYSWRWIFVVNVPVGIAAFALAWRVLDRDTPERDVKLDWVGLALLSPGLTALVYGLAEVASGSPFATIHVGGALLTGAVLIAAFVWHALHTDAPLLDLTLYKARAFAAGSATTFILGGALFGAMILVPLYYQVVRGEGALMTGLLMAPQGIGAAIAMPISGRLTDKSGPGRIVLVGLAFVFAGTVAYVTLTPTTSYAFLTFALFLRGIGLGFTMMPAMAAAYQTLSRSAVPRATTMLNILNRVGGSVGVALLSVMLERNLQSSHPTPAGMASAFGTTFWWATALVVVSAIPALLLPRIAPAPVPRPAQEEPEREVVLASVD
jgi:EmrB/QacA subfamily drug resistance transporter